MKIPTPIEKYPKPEKRIIVSLCFIIVVFLILIGRLWFLQIINGQEYRVMAEGNRIRLKRIKSPRGLIMDRHHQILAQNKPSFTVSIVPEDVKDDMENVLSRLSGIINKPLDKMQEIIQESELLPFEPITLKSDLTFQEVTLLEEHIHSLPGITVEIASKRYYPFEEVAAHILGYVGEVNKEQLQQQEEFKSARPGDIIGQSGLEKVANRYLMGKEGGKHVEVDAIGREMRTLGYLPPEPGENILLTIDLDLQKKAEEILGKNTGAIVAMDPQNGKILALVSHPTFNPNMFARRISKDEWLEILDNPKNPLQNRAIMAHYPPGSIFKLVVASAGLGSGSIEAWNSFYCGGSINLGKWTFYCWKKEGHGEISLHNAIVNSCNCFFYQLGSKLGIDTIANYARMYGLGSPTNISLLGENSGLIPDTSWKKKAFAAPWYPGETITASIGQGYILTTPIQLACLISVFANGGSLYQPMLIDSLESFDGKMTEQFSPVLKRKVSLKSEDLQIIRNALRGVIENGTGRKAFIPDIPVAGKTGTAQVVKMREPAEDDTGSEESTPESLRDHAWFVGFAPFDQPKIAVAVFVEHGGHGGYTCAPIAKEIIQAYLKGAQRVD